MNENIKKFLGKTVFIRLKSDIYYNGQISSIEDDSSLILFIDKKLGEILINILEIKTIEPRGL